MPTQRKRVAIVGAGASGLPAIRHALLYDIDVVCFEASEYVGGLWRYKPHETDESSVMKTTVINTSKEMTAYSDYPPDDEMANFMHNTQMYKYLQSYAKHFDLERHIKFKHCVLNVKRADDYATSGQWTVTYMDNYFSEQTEVFDGVLMCSGHHTIPHMPEEWEGQKEYRGKIIHSHSYKDHRGYEDKVIVVVGVGNSGGDVAVELSKIAKQVYLVTRRGAWVFNRVFDYGNPFDLVLQSRFQNLLNHVVPSSLTNEYLEWKLNYRFDHARFGLKPKHRVLGAHPTVNDELPNRISCGTVKIRPNIRRFTENGVEFEDGRTVEEVDDVILCTGFSFEFKLVEEGRLIPVVENEVDLYQNMYPIATADHNSLAVIGLVQPFGSIMPISEMQCRVFFENLFGTHKIPSKTEMQNSITAKKEALHRRYVKSRRHTIQVDYIDYMDELAKLAGCYPNMPQIFKQDPFLALKVFFGPTVPYQYRIIGPNSWTGAKKAIEELDERVYKATNNGPYQPSRLLPYIFIAFVALSILLYIIF